MEMRDGSEKRVTGTRAVEMRVTIGRIIHYCATGKEPPVFPSCQHFDAHDRVTHSANHPTALSSGELCAGIVALAFENNDVTATLLIPGGGLLSVRCSYAETPMPGRWSWPARV